MLPAVTELFKSTFDDSLKKLVAPAGLIPSTFFVLLNLVAIYPLLVALKWPLAIGFKGLDGLWQVVIATAAVVGVGYLTVAVSTSAGRVFTGEAITGSLHDALKRDEDARYDRLVKAAGNTKGPLRAQLEGRFPHPDGAEVRGATALANASNAIAWSLWTSYHIDLSSLFQQFRLVLAKEDEPTLKALDELRAPVDTLLNTVALLVVFIGECLIVALAFASPSLAPWALAALVVAIALYRAAVTITVSWGDGVQAAFDLHRDKLATALGLPAVPQSAERDLWANVSSALQWVGPAPTSWIDAEVAARVTVTHSGNVTATLVAARDDDVKSSGGSSAARTWTTRHTILVTASGPRRSAARALVVIADEHWPNLPHTPTLDRSLPTGVSATADILRSNDRDSISWTLEGLAGDTALLLVSSVAKGLTLSVTPDQGACEMSLLDDADDDPATHFLLALLGDAPAASTAALVDERCTRQGRLSVHLWLPNDGGELPVRTSIDGVGKWTLSLPPMEPGLVYRLFVEPETGE